MLRDNTPDHTLDADPRETAEWIESIAAVAQTAGNDRATFLLDRIQQWADRNGVRIPHSSNTPYINTIHHSQQPPYPGDREIERRIKSFVRWNAMAMVVRANRREDGIGGHISTYASAATLWEVGFNHFFRGAGEDRPADLVYFQGHGSPGIYARAYLEGRLEEHHLENFRRELAPGGGLSSYPHPWLMKDFWQCPTVSMGLGPISSIYQARFNEYLRDRGLLDTAGAKVWAFLGDGEMDEPESLGAITLASREQLDNLIWVVNCNLQRLDGPVRGNGSVIQELEAAFRGAGWNVQKVIWGSDWDPLFDADAEGELIDAMGRTVDGQWQRYTVESGAYAREHFFGQTPGLQKLVEHYSDEQIRTLRLGGHDPAKVHAAYQAAVEHTGAPTVILARTIKGYGLGEAGEGRNVTHQQKKLNEDEMKLFRDKFDIPISDRDIKDAPFCRFEKGSPEYEYLTERRRALGGPLPQRKVRAEPIKAPGLDRFDEFLKGSGGRKASTTMAYMRMLARLMKDKQVGKLIVPIVPDEARTFGMEALFRTYGIYAHAGQHYEPVDHEQLMRYEERQDGQILEEGITEAGSMASFTAAGSAYASHGVNTIPFFTYYSMFGFQRIGDSIWAASDMRCRGFLVGATAGRTTLNGEGLQHQDGHSHVLASTVPSVRAYDPAFACELAVIIQHGIKRMFEEGEDRIYYITAYNENYTQPPLVPGAEEGILRGLYKFRPAEAESPDPRTGREARRDDVAAGPRTGRESPLNPSIPESLNPSLPNPSIPESLNPSLPNPSIPESLNPCPHIHLFGSGALMHEALRAQQILADRFNVAADVWSVTSYNQLYRDAIATERWNRLHPDQQPRCPFIEQALADEPWPIVAVTDYMQQLADRLQRWTPMGIVATGTDGFGRSDSRQALRRHFEVEAEHIALAALTELARHGRFDQAKLPEAIQSLGIDPNHEDPAYAASVALKNYPS